ncbi:anhydro-N-acetylmuramic acid kinase [Legionella hackeliae]|uniref:Anhydro-N-acetylmuramic acid kinase n=2 Tax=Legionella hackeliae TaxID=449 RepID=A0A0A8UVK5_LEGHA|nr:anhydro-N-acetylmuramic acid kinase [Legionella hackeliae]CEK10804.1 Anhydro-N-acetylmuramic acid kinase [Legionella hackeliae]STX47541.1 anhydro-N-acetylmuramic acid kinase [Legionella hackeliae]
MDGIDAAAIELASNTFIDGLTKPYSQQAKNLLEEVLQEKSQSLAIYSQLNTILGREFAQAALLLMEKTNLSSTSIQAVGSHGQTLCHDASAEIPYTVQLGCAHTIAELTGVTVVADFRTRDLIVGGQGAPFAPIYHQALFKDQQFPLAVVNVGGIANLSYLSNASRVHGYDTGPGNCLMDAWIKKNLGKDYDKNGDWAASGKVIEPLLRALLNDPYFKKSQPKSIGKEYFSLAWLEQHLKPHYSSVDVQATLLMLTANTIADAVNRETQHPTQVLICGGGAHNQALMQILSSLLPETPVKSTSAYGVNPDFIEALMFAWLADKTLMNEPLDMSQITGASRLAILGTIYPAGIDKRNWLRV